MSKYLQFLGSALKLYQLVAKVDQVYKTPEAMLVLSYVEMGHSIKQISDATQYSTEMVKFYLGYFYKNNMALFNVEKEEPMITEEGISRMNAYNAEMDTKVAFNDTMNANLLKVIQSLEDAYAPSCNITVVNTN